MPRNGEKQKNELWENAHVVLMKLSKLPIEGVDMITGFKLQTVNMSSKREYSTIQIPLHRNLKVNVIP